MTIDFLSVDEVLFLNRQQLQRFGGADGVRDLSLLESAAAQPQSSFGGSYLHGDLFEMAAAYLSHIVKSHPFVDGNKRTGLLAALVFLDLNGIIIDQGNTELFSLTLGTAEGKLDKSFVTQKLRALVT